MKEKQGKRFRIGALCLALGIIFWGSSIHAGKLPKESKETQTDEIQTVMPAPPPVEDQRDEEVMVPSASEEGVPSIRPLEYKQSPVEEEFAEVAEAVSRKRTDSTHSLDEGKTSVKSNLFEEMEERPVFRKNASPIHSADQGEKSVEEEDLESNDGWCECCPCCNIC